MSDVPLEQASGDWVRLDVQDSGSGMTPEVRQRVFEPFFTTKPMGKGTGLDLAMVYATMGQFGGTASVDSVLGRGTTISLWFPASTQAAMPEPAQLTVPPPAKATGRVLLVEDEVAVRGVSARWLRRAGYDVTEADDGLDGLRFIEGDGEAPFDIIISDVMMPRMGGGEFGEAVRRRLPHIPLLFLSGFYSEDRIAPLLAMPRTRLLPKPFALPALTDAVAEMLAER